MKLRILQGRRRGREYSVGKNPVTIGRAAQCDIVIPDDQLVSSEHADVRMDEHGQMVIRDLESVNGTEVNGQSIDESVLKPGDEISIGSTLFEVIEEAARPVRESEPPKRGPATEKLPVVTKPAVEEAEEETAEEEQPRRKEEEVEEAGETGEEAPAELTFGGKPKRPAKKKPAAPIGRRLMSLGLTALLTIVAIGGGLYVWKEVQRSMPQVVSSMGGETRRPDLFYEKVEASTQNIFRFALRLSGDKVTLNVDDLKQRRHVQREKKVGEGLIIELVRQIENGGFDKLEKPKYGGFPADKQEMAVIELTRGARVKRVEIENTIAPDAFVNAQKVLEDFAQNELGIAAINRSREELIREADEAYLRGKQLFEQRDVDYPNLYNAIKAFQLVQIDLEIIEPKPANFAAAVQNETLAKDMLKEKINSLRFNAEQAMKLGEWAKAQTCLSEILARVPDREDERYKEADRKLIGVQRHLPRR
ncbi:MAG: FHA domain-containing protein [Verrucomicrobia bacterium]|nr:FHA domain-containing protein [Verrucomicrobiota bacterium]